MTKVKKSKNKKETGVKSFVKVLILLAFISTIVFAINTTGNNKSSATELKWNEKVESAIAVAKKENKPILVDFTGSDWCIWCKKLSEEVFTQKEFIEYANKNLVLVKLDFPKNIEQSQETVYYNRQMAQKYGIQGFPTIILLDSNGEVINYTGYQDGGAQSYIEHIKGLLTKS